MCMGFGFRGVPTLNPYSPDTTSQEFTGQSVPSLCHELLWGKWVLLQEHIRVRHHVNVSICISVIRYLGICLLFWIKNGICFVDTMLQSLHCSSCTAFRYDSTMQIEVTHVKAYLWIARWHRAAQGVPLSRSASLAANEQIAFLNQTVGLCCAMHNLDENWHSWTSWPISVCCVISSNREYIKQCKELTGLPASGRARMYKSQVFGESVMKRTWSRPNCNDNIQVAEGMQRMQSSRTCKVCCPCSGRILCIAGLETAQACLLYFYPNAVEYALLRGQMLV